MTTKCQKLNEKWNCTISKTNKTKTKNNQKTSHRSFYKIKTTDFKGLHRKKILQPVIAIYIQEQQITTAKVNVQRIAVQWYQDRNLEARTRNQIHNATVNVCTSLKDFMSLEILLYSSGPQKSAYLWIRQRLWKCVFKSHLFLLLYMWILPTLIKCAWFLCT